MLFDVEVSKVPDITKVPITDFGKSVFTEGLIFFLIRAAVTAVIAIIVVKLLNRINRKALLLRGKSPEDQSLVYINKTINTIIYIIAGLIIASDIIPLRGLGKTVLGASGIVAVVVGLAAQETFGNYIAGFFLALYQPFRVGDRITIPSVNVIGTVKEITFRHTVVRTPVGTDVIIPNAVLNKDIIEDKSYGGKSYYSQCVEVSVGYETDLPACYEVICDIVEKAPLFKDTRSKKDIKNGAPIVNVIFKEFQDSGLLLLVPLTAESVETINPLCNYVREQILVEFAKHNINIPYPITTVQMEKDA